MGKQAEKSLKDVLLESPEKKKTVYRQIIDKAIDNIVDLNLFEKLQFQFERDYPGKKIYEDQQESDLFLKWLREHKLLKIYFKSKYCGDE